MHVFRGQPPERRMVVFSVVPLEEVRAERAGVFDAAETAWKLGPVFERLELTLRKGIVVRDVRPAVRFRHAQVAQQHGHAFGLHRGASVGVNRQLR